MSSPRVPELDALRGVGALAILGFHLWPSVFFFGWTRADLFFVISGYVITGVIVRHGLSRGFLLRFWARRALRIWPAYYTMLAILFIIGRCGGHPLPLEGLIAHATFTQNLPYYWSDSVPDFPPAAQPTWSLAIEEQFYLFWPMVVVAIGRWILIPAGVWMLAMSMAARLDGIYPAIAVARADGLALGAILAVLVERVRSVRGARMGSAALTITCILGLYLASAPLPRYEASIPGISGCGPWSILVVNLVYFSIVGLIVLNRGHWLLAPLRWHPLAYLGRVSYGVYLYHFLIIESIRTSFGDIRPATGLAAAALSVLAGVISWECLEKPIGNLKHRLPYEARGADPAD